MSLLKLSLEFCPFFNSTQNCSSRKCFNWYNQIYSTVTECFRLSNKLLQKYIYYPFSLFLFFGKHSITVMINEIIEIGIVMPIRTWLSQPIVSLFHQLRHQISMPKTYNGGRRQTPSTTTKYR